MRSKRILDALRSAASRTPLVRRHLSPLFLGRITSFQAHCKTAKSLPEHFDHHGFYLPIFEPTTERRSAPHCLQEKDLRAFWNQVTSYQGGSEVRTQPVFLAGISDASVLAGGIAIRSRENYVFCEPFHIPEHVERVRSPLLPPIDRRLRGDYIHLGLLWGMSHFHWVLDVLPRLLIVEQFERLRGMPFLLPNGLTHQQRESLLYLGIASERLVEFIGCRWRVERLYYPSTLHLTGNPSSLATRWLRERFVSRRDAQKRLYVSRADAATRRILNEDELVKELCPFGFDVVSLGGMCFSKQVELFSQAGIIIGAHGAGLTNSVFAPPGATVMEIFPPSYINGCFWALANVCGQKYGFLIGKQHEQDIKVDIGGVLRLLALMGISKH